MYLQLWLGHGIGLDLNTVGLVTGSAALDIHVPTLIFLNK